MKILINYIRIKGLLICITLLFTHSVFSQLDYEYPQSQKTKLDDVAKEIWKLIPTNTRQYNTIAIMQIPNTQRFVISGSGATLPSHVKNKTGVEQIFRILSENHFTASELRFVTGYGTEVSKKFEDVYDNVYYCPLPGRYTGTSFQITARLLAVHAEMAMISYLAIYENYITAYAAPKNLNIIIGVDKAYCARCYNFLKDFNIFTAEGDHIFGLVAKPIKSHENWSPPNYFRQVLNHRMPESSAGLNIAYRGYEWPEWLRNGTSLWSENFQLTFPKPNGTIVDLNQVSEGGYIKFPASPLYNLIYNTYYPEDSE
ncbi:hypothetical protein [Aquimarina sp. RZ0]|uniref:hypothetical protein n=1 Tax=Aquimarina sp. RZ0 TaxID=2607730 RepID=UPI0011F3432D|nr:hypothetical protein [Aquimarina sp. RZ0]KAA1242880.1 hypothetical protein F0000_23590 [Aquimarina sp. RZ0]